MLFSKKTDSNATPDDTPEQSGFLQKIARMPGGRFITPLVLAATIGGSVHNALAEPSRASAMSIASIDSSSTRRTYDTFGDLETSAHTAREVAEYFAKNKTDIIKKLNAHVTDEKILKSLLNTVEMVSKNQDGTSFAVNHNGALSNDETQVMALFDGARESIEVSPHFNVTGVADQGHIIHEGTHVQQRIDQKKLVAKGKISQNNFDGFWNFGRAHPGQGMVVTEDETEGMAAQVEYINAQLNGLIQKLIDEAPGFKEAEQVLENNPIIQKAIANKVEREQVIKLSLAYFGNSEGWISYVKYLYECRQQRTPFTPKLAPAQSLDHEECEQIRVVGKVVRQTDDR